MSSESAKYPPARPPHSIAVVQQYNSVITGVQSISVLVGQAIELVNKVEFFSPSPENCCSPENGSLRFDNSEMVISRIRGLKSLTC